MAFFESINIQHFKKEQLRELALFSGGCGGILASKILGWVTVCAVEINAYCVAQTLARQNEGCLPPFPIWDDVRTFNGQNWKGIIEIISGGFPCKETSFAGKNTGFEGKNSSLWKEMVRITDQIRPKYIFVENTGSINNTVLSEILCDIAKLGYDAKWCHLSAENTGAFHKRNRIWIQGISREFST